MNRLLDRLLPGRSADALRLWALFAVLVTVAQFNEFLLEPTFEQQFLYWSVRLVVVAVSLFTSQWLVDRLLPNALLSPAWLKPVVLVSALAILPFTLVELALESNLPMVPAYDDDDLMSISPLLAYASEYGTNATIIIPLHFLVWLLLERRTAPSPADAPAAGHPAPEFLQKTRGIKTTDILAVKAEEHYVLIYTNDGSELVHHKFGSAVSQLPDNLGLQVHRSWWVAENHVRDASRGARRWQVTLSNGVEVPVSDGFVKQVRQRGLLKCTVKRS